MFKRIESLSDDPILKLSQLCRDDQRAHKIDVSVGIFKDVEGNTPIMRAVKASEKRVWDTQTTKKYQPLSGNSKFNELLGKLVMGNAWDESRMRVNQSTGGTGALRVIAEAVKELMPNGKFWIPDPTWDNHMAVFGSANLAIERYPYLNTKTCEVDREKIFAALEKMGEDDAVLLHGCCHNPSGADLSHEDWHKIADLANAKGFTPIIDFAYMGLGESIDEDAYGMRLIAKSVAQSMIAVSCSKNFALYCDRTGIIISVGKNAQEAQGIQSHFNMATRKLISMSPDHGAAVVAAILEDPELKADWLAELNEMCAFIRERREKLQAAFADDTSRDWSFITRHHGMFTLLPLGVDNVMKLREDYAIYIVGTGRINLAGLNNDDKIAYFADSVKKIISA